MERKECVFIVNPKSGEGKGSEYGKRIKDWCDEYGINSLVIPTSKEGENTAFELGKKAAKERARTIGIVGGDGTIYLFINGMMASNVPPEQFPAIGLIPAGIGNNFAKNNGIPQEFEEQMKVIRHGRTILVDAGALTVEGIKKYFLNVVSFGFDAEITRKAKIEKEKYFFIPKVLTYGLTAFREILRGLPFYQLRVQGLGFDFDAEMSLAAVLIGPTYGAIFHIAPGADSADGLFDVCLIDKIDSNLRGKKRAAEILLRATKGKHIGQPEVCLYRTPFLKVSSLQPIPCEIDGEILPAERQYEISILPKTLKVLTPAALAAVQEPLVVKANAPEYQSV